MKLIDNKEVSIKYITNRKCQTKFRAGQVSQMNEKKKQQIKPYNETKSEDNNTRKIKKSAK